MKIFIGADHRGYVMAHQIYEELKKENISNASTIDSLSVTEIEDAYQKFYDIIEGTIFEKLIINAFAGNV